jgi:hypothetical protein
MQVVSFNLIASQPPYTRSKLKSPEFLHLNFQTGLLLNLLALLTSQNLNGHNYGIF